MDLFFLLETWLDFQFQQLFCSICNFLDQLNFILKVLNVIFLLC